MKQKSYKKINKNKKTSSVFRTKSLFLVDWHKGRVLPGTSSCPISSLLSHGLDVLFGRCWLHCWYASVTDHSGLLLRERGKRERLWGAVEERGGAVKGRGRGKRVDKEENIIQSCLNKQKEWLQN